MAMMKTHPLSPVPIRKALVVGGGIAGPVTALALRRAGIAATIYEAYDTSAEGLGGMLMLAPNGLDALRVVGVDAGALGQPVGRMIMGDGTGKRFGEFPGLPGLPPSRLLWRSDLYRLLRERAVEQGVRIEHGKRLVGVDDEVDGVIARFADGSAARGDVLVGADGIRSTVRELIDPGALRPEYVGFLGFGGFSTATVEGAPPDAIHFVFGKRAFMGHWSPPGGGTAWFSNLPHPDPLTMSEARRTPTADWLRRLREAYADDVPGRTLVEHTSADQLFVFGAGEILPSVPCWHRGRVVLVGDAAHAPSSSSGQGASLAAESGVQLARCLRDVRRPDRREGADANTDVADVGEAFAVYERLRRPRVEKIAAQAAKTNGNKTAGPIGKALMSLLMPIAMRTFMTPERMFGWIHRHRIDWDEPVDGGYPTAPHAANAC
jgi:2-polyprenyl-6-methoxyphenol hydroxylase-like FAD-dependent oxidoreductase